MFMCEVFHVRHPIPKDLFNFDDIKSISNVGKNESGKK